MSAPSRALHRVGLLACFTAVVALCVGGAIAWLRDAKLGRPTIVFDYARMMGKRLPEVRASRDRAYTVAVLGDSALVSYPAGRSVPERLQAELDRRSSGAPIAVHSLGMPGAGVFDYYFLSDRIADARPHLVVVALNLDHFSRAWLGAYSRPQLAGLLAPRHVPEALSLPLFPTGLTTDRLLFYDAIVAAGGYEPWYWLTLRQAQVGRARDRFERWLGGSPDYRAHDPAPSTPEEVFRDAADARTIDRVFTDANLYRYRIDSVLEHYGGPLAGLAPEHPALQVLGATLRHLRASGAEVLVYVVPVDVAWIDSLGALDAAGLDETLAAVRRVVERDGGTFVDVHDALPTEAFRDAPGHLVYEGHDRYDGRIDGPSRLAELLAPHVLARADDALGRERADRGD